MSGGNVAGMLECVDIIVIYYTFLETVLQKTCSDHNGPAAPPVPAEL